MKKAFELGRIFISMNALCRLGCTDIQEALKRHTDCDWGDLDTERKKLNDITIRDNHGRVFSAYHSPNGEKFLVITETDLRLTVVILPKDHITLR